MPIIILFVRKISRQEWIIVWPIILIKIIHIQKIYQSCCNSLWSLRILSWQWFRKKRHLVYFMVCYSKFRRITMDFVKIYHYTISFEMSELDIERSFEIFTVEALPRNVIDTNHSLYINGNEFDSYSIDCYFLRTVQCLYFHSLSKLI